MHTEKILFLLSILLLSVTFSPAQSNRQAPSTHSDAILLTIPVGVPIRVSLEKPVRIKHAGVPVKARVLEPVYVFDRMVIPAGSELLGRVASVDGVSKSTRILAIANGDFTPLRTAHIEFDTLLLKTGKRVPIRTAVSPGSENVVHLAAGGKAKKEGRVRKEVKQAKQSIKEQEQQAIEEVKAPGKLKRLEAGLEAELPYHRQSLAKGTRFTAELKAPLAMGDEDWPGKELARMGSEIPPGTVVHTWLTTPLNSATTHKGSAVEAVVAQPVFSQDHHLILPEGSRLEGSVTKALPARHLGRNGKLRFTFRRIDLPQGTRKRVEAGLQGVNLPSAAHVKLDKEGGAHAASSKTKYLMPAIDALLASTSIDGDSGRRAIQESASGDSGNLAGGAVRGGAGFGLAGSLIAMAARSQTLTSAFAFYGAAWSVYSHLVARGRDVVFPKDTEMDIRFGTHEEPASSAPKGEKNFEQKAAESGGS
jgi:hypothetical protein